MPAKIFSPISPILSSFFLKFLYQFILSNDSALKYQCKHSSSWNEFGLQWSCRWWPEPAEVLPLDALQYLYVSKVLWFHIVLSEALMRGLKKREWNHRIRPNCFMNAPGPCFLFTPLLRLDLGEWGKPCRWMGPGFKFPAVETVGSDQGTNRT